MNFLRKNVVSLESKFFGLDLSDLSVKVFQIERSGKTGKIRSLCSLPIARGNIEDGKVIHKEIVAGVIREALKKSWPKKITTQKVICSLPESNIFLRVINIPKVKEEEAEQAIKWEMEANIPLPIEEVYFDWQFLEGAEDKKTNRQSVLTVAVSKKVVDDFMETMRLAGLEIYDMEIESIASARSLVSANEKEENISLIVDIGARRTSFIIVEGIVPCFTSSIPFSSESINDAISKRMSIGDKESEEIKIAFGIENFNKDNPIFNSIKYLLENLVTEIEKTIDFYLVMSKTPREVNKIILCGGGSNLKGLVDYLSQRVGREVALGDPLVNLSLEKKEREKINRENCIGYATVIGLAIKNFIPGVGLNLIPPERKREINKLHFNKLVIWWEIEVFLILLFFLGLLFHIFYLSNQNSVFSSQQLEASRQEYSYRDLEDYKEKIKMANSQVSNLEKIQKSQLYWSKLLDKLNGLVSEGIKIESLITKDYQVSLVGTARNRDELAAFKDKLTGESCFTDINFPLSNLASRDNPSFQIQFLVKEECLKIIK